MKQMMMKMIFKSCICLLYFCLIISCADMNTQRQPELIVVQNTQTEDSGATLELTSKMVKELYRSIKKCKKREPVKFWPSYKIIVKYDDSSEEIYLISDNYLKYNGLTYVCNNNLGALINAALKKEVKE